MTRDEKSMKFIVDESVKLAGLDFRNYRNDLAERCLIADITARGVFVMPAERAKTIVAAVDALLDELRGVQNDR